MSEKQDRRRVPHSDYRYWLYDHRDGGMAYYRTREDRDAAGKKAVASYLLYDEWDEEVDSVAAGEVTHIAQCLDLALRPQELDDDGCDDEGTYWGDAESMGSYTFEPLAPSTP